ncbi:hypothetical protein RSOL_244620 [Rhizoctonia solani AG-3 Rhs1AP]|uniref:HNH nuclease domain-containing protein n=1 Tax=Rhizoctonia solani AG-3 Rhs1AP TaxID=1086054 RepID=A0A0A1UHY0_9AGAM|nr:hypothetical protein RSOL_244620 [Rhizoctonia solani AG-3 Rhs1AP]
MTDWHPNALNLLDKYVPRTPEDPTEPILRALVAHAPTKRGQQNLCQDILKCGGTATTEEIDISERLYNLGQYYVSALLVPMLRGGKTSWDTRIHLSKETNLVPTISPLLIEQAKHDLEKTQVLALVRDNYRCVISGVPDFLACETHLVQDPDAREIAFTTAARILPLSFAGGGESASVWTALSKFSGMDVASELSGHNINRLGNIFTVTIRDHWPFSGLYACLEAVEGKEHTYRVARCLPGIKLPVGKESHLPVLTRSSSYRTLDSSPFMQHVQKQYGRAGHSAILIVSCKIGKSCRCWQKMAVHMCCSMRCIA